MNENDQNLGPDEYARWALLGDPHARVPLTLKELVERVGLALRQYAAANKKSEKESIPMAAPELCCLLEEKFKNLTNLFARPELGLFSWGFAVAEEMKFVNNWWQGKFDYKTKAING